MAQAEFAAVDWGTSGFRLWLIGADGQVLAERKSREGMMAAAQTGFAKVLESHLLAASAAPNLPVIICGMAGAKQGWVEAGYIDLPTRLDGIAQKAVRVDHPTRDIRILPGLARREPAHADVMRGEETQLLGVGTDGDGLVCMPGTHSKWVRLQQGMVTAFSTFMTGELFAVISQHTILQHAIKDSGKDSGGFDETSEAFGQAVRHAYTQPQNATNQLFSIRASGLLFRTGPVEAEATLSGTLIGLEMAGGLAAGLNGPVMLVAEGRLADLYSAAFNRLDIELKLVNADTCVLKGLTNAARSIWPNHPVTLAKSKDSSA